MVETRQPTYGSAGVGDMGIEVGDGTGEDVLLTLARNGRM
jgi:hypothetical protein